MLLAILEPFLGAEQLQLQTVHIVYKLYAVSSDCPYRPQTVHTAYKLQVDDFSQDGVQQKDKHSNIMTDDAPKVVDYLSSLKGKPSQVDFILDNCGYELFTDLVLTYFLLEFNWTDTVMLHCKEVRLHSAAANCALLSHVPRGIFWPIFVTST